MRKIQQSVMILVLSIALLLAGCGSSTVPLPNTPPQLSSGLGESILILLTYTGCPIGVFISSSRYATVDSRTGQEITIADMPRIFISPVTAAQKAAYDEGGKALLRVLEEEQLILIPVNCEFKGE